MDSPRYIPIYFSKISPQQERHIRNEIVRRYEAADSSDQRDKLSDLDERLDCHLRDGLSLEDKFERELVLSVIDRHGYQ